MTKPMTKAEKTKLKSKASYLVNLAVRKGKLAPVTSLICIDCGAPATRYDHRDYTKPLEVEPVCYSCNYWRGPGLPFIQEDEGYTALTKDSQPIRCLCCGQTISVINKPRRSDNGSKLEQ